MEVNTVWNWANATSAKVAQPFASKPKWPSGRIVDQYRHIIVGDVSSARLAQTRMAKSVLDAGWRMLRTHLQYKGEYAGRSVMVVSEKHTSRACSSCGCLSGPSGLRQLVVRQWECSACGTGHDRDVPPSSAYRVREVGTESAKAAA